MDELVDPPGLDQAPVTDSYSSELFSDYELASNATELPVTYTEIFDDYSQNVYGIETNLHNASIIDTQEATRNTELASSLEEGASNSLSDPTDSPLIDSSSAEPIVETFSNVTSSALEKLQDIGISTSTTADILNSTSVEPSSVYVSTTQESVMTNITNILNTTDVIPSLATLNLDEAMHGFANVTESLSIEMAESSTKASIIIEESNRFLSNSTKQGVDQELISKMDEFFRGITGPDYMSLNNSLCESYLPTLEETPAAMGTMGIVLWILGSAITLSLIILLGKHSYFIYKTAHKTFRLHIFYVNSIFMVMALLTSIGTAVPRAHGACSAIKDVYMSIGVAHFVDLTFAMYGGENAMAHYVKDRVIDLRKVPLFCCCLCLPGCIPTKRAINILKWLVWQMKWSQFAYYLLRLIILYAVQNSLGMVSGGPSYAWLNILNLISFLPGVFALFVIGNLVSEDLQERYNYGMKEKVVRLTILTTKLQRILFDILEGFGVFPCYPPYVSSRFYKNILKDFIYLVEVLLLGILSYIAYSKPGEFERGTSKELTRKNFDKDSEQHDENGYRDALSQRAADLPESAC